MDGSCHLQKHLLRGSVVAMEVVFKATAKHFQLLCYVCAFPILQQWSSLNGDWTYESQGAPPHIRRKPQLRNYIPSELYYHTVRKLTSHLAGDYHSPSFLRKLLKKSRYGKTKNCWGKDYEL